MHIVYLVVGPVLQKMRLVACGGRSVGPPDTLAGGPPAGPTSSHAAGQRF